MDFIFRAYKLKGTISKQNMADCLFSKFNIGDFKPMTKIQVLTCTIRFYDPKQASRTISSHSDCFRALNAAFFSYQRFHLFKANLYIERFFYNVLKEKSLNFVFLSKYFFLL